nr:hypothetical protein [Tanacetum cinerariifolium]
FNEIEDKEKNEEVDGSGGYNAAFGRWKW